MNRIAIGDLRLVYVLCADKKIQYPWGRTPIAYIGTTKNGVHRVASSAASRAEHILGQHGIKAFDVRIVTCGARTGVKTWCQLERALLLHFRERFGEVPLCNTIGKGMSERAEFDLFSRDRVRQIINDLTENGLAGGGEISA